MSDRPNVIVCLTDQLRPFEVGCYGSEIVQTPNIDQLASKGVRFEIACSNNPVCTAARSVVLSGQYSRTCVGTARNASEPVPERGKMLTPTLAEVFRAAGYRTGLIGKWHIDPLPEQLGFNSVVYPHHSHRYTGQTFFSEDRKEVTVDGCTVDYELNALRTWLPAHKDHPFFLFHNISQPHMPLWDAPELIRDMYRPEFVSMRENVWQDGKMAYDEHWFKIYLHDFLYYERHLPYTEHLPDGFDLRSLVALYYGSVSWTDYQVGELMRALKENGLAENTIVVFTSDHGDMLGSHHMFNKDSLYEEALRIPFIVSWPAKLSPHVAADQVTSLVDVMPTTLSLAGLTVPGYVQGTDLSMVLRGKAETVGDSAAFIETSQHQVGIRTASHLYGYKKQTGRGGDPDVSLFDLDQDPMQCCNLAGEPRHAVLEHKLRERLDLWDEQTPWLSAPPY